LTARDEISSSFSVIFSMVVISVLFYRQQFSIVRVQEALWCHHPPKIPCSVSSKAPSRGPDLTAFALEIAPCTGRRREQDPSPKSKPVAGHSTRFLASLSHDLNCFHGCWHTLTTGPCSKGKKVRSRPILLHW
jgi:hypothetical protein